MATVTRYPSEYNIVLGTWNNPTNMYNDDTTYTTSLGARNSNWQITFSNFGFSIPTGSIINSVKYEFAYMCSTTSSAETITLSSVYNGIAKGTDLVLSDEPIVMTSYSKTTNGTWTVNELNSALCEASIILRRTSNTTCTYSFDFIRIIVDYTPPIMTITGATSLIGTSNINVIASAFVPAPKILGSSQLIGSSDISVIADAFPYNGYIIEKKINTGEFAYLATVSFDTYEYIDINVESGITYTYRIKYYQNGIESLYSNEWSYTIETSINKPAYTNISGVVKNLTKAQANINGVIVNLTKAQTNIDGVIKTIWIKQ